MVELQALRWFNLKDEYIEISSSWDRKYGLKAPKASSARIVPLTPTVSVWLDQLK
jgi:integrase